MQDKTEQKPNENFFLRIAEEARRNEVDVNIKKNRLFITIMSEWNQEKSTFFWKQVFNHIDFKVINDLFRYIKGIINQGYPCRNPSALFVSELKKMGYYPFDKEVKNDTRQQQIHSGKQEATA